jgi:hypothetical protein
MLVDYYPLAVKRFDARTGAEKLKDVLEGSIWTSTHTIEADWYHGEERRDLGLEKSKEIEGRDI